KKKKHRDAGAAACAAVNLFGYVEAAAQPRVSLCERIVKRRPCAPGAARCTPATTWQRHGGKPRRALPRSVGHVISIDLRSWPAKPPFLIWKHEEQHGARTACHNRATTADTYKNKTEHREL
ncbi:hypothetical protein NDU88_002117, partial [Pleurodeles waltl]